MGFLSPRRAAAGAEHAARADALRARLAACRRRREALGDRLLGVARSFPELAALAARACVPWYEGREDRAGAAAGRVARTSTLITRTTAS